MAIGLLHRRPVLALVPQLCAGGAAVKVGEEIVRVLEAFDLPRPYRAAGELVGCEHYTVRKYVLLRDAVQVALGRPQRAPAFNVFIEEIEAWVEPSLGTIRADMAHEKLVAMGLWGSDRRTRRAVAAANVCHRHPFDGSQEGHGALHVTAPRAQPPSENLRSLRQRPVAATQ